MHMQRRNFYADDFWNYGNRGFSVVLRRCSQAIFLLRIGQVLREKIQRRELLLLRFAVRECSLANAWRECRLLEALSITNNVRYVRQTLDIIPLFACSENQHTCSANNLFCSRIDVTSSRWHLIIRPFVETRWNVLQHISCVCTTFSVTRNLTGAAVNRI